MTTPQIKYESIKKEYQESFENLFSKKDLHEYNSDLLNASSCAIEGNSFTVDDARALREKGLFLKLQNKSMLEALEILDHSKAWEFLTSNLERPLTEQLLIETQKLVTRNTIAFTKGYDPGVYTDKQMMAGETIFAPHEESIKKVRSLMEVTQIVIENGEIHPIEISAKFHQYFIYLHPFPDGNGRTGRLISNYILAKTKNPIVIIKKDKKEEYIQSLKASHLNNEEKIITDFFFSTSVERMKLELSKIREKGQSIFVF